jgi:predicted Holliday junction resolvase-like endonuclease
MKILIGKYKIQVEILLAIVVFLLFVFAYILSRSRFSLFEGATAMNTPMNVNYGYDNYTDVQVQEEIKKQQEERRLKEIEKQEAERDATNKTNALNAALDAKQKADAAVESARAFLNNLT